MSKQITIPYRMKCTHQYPDGTSEQVWYGQYEAIEIVTENGWDVNTQRNGLLIPSHEVTDVKKTDGTIVIFEEPFYKISLRGYGCD